MSPLYLYNNQLLLSNNKLSTGIACCCSSSSSSSSSSGTNCISGSLICDGVPIEYNVYCNPACFFQDAPIFSELAEDPYVFNGPYTEGDLQKIFCFAKERGYGPFILLSNEENNVFANSYCCEWDDNDVTGQYLPDSNSTWMVRKCLNSGCVDCGSSSSSSSTDSDSSSSSSSSESSSNSSESSSNSSESSSSSSFSESSSSSNANLSYFGPPIYSGVFCQAPLYLYGVNGYYLAAYVAWNCETGLPRTVNNTPEGPDCAGTVNGECLYNVFFTNAYGYPVYYFVYDESRDTCWPYMGNFIQGCNPLP